MNTNPLQRAIELLLERHGWTARELTRQSNVAQTTLQRISRTGEARKDVRARLEDALDIERGTLGRVQRGELDPADMGMNADTDISSTALTEQRSIDWRVTQVEAELADLGDQVREVARQLGELQGRLLPEDL